jgi:hypothetical protein
MFGGLAFLCDGRMCCGIVGTDLMVRVPIDAYESTLAEPHVRPMDFTGRPMKGFVYVARVALLQMPRGARSMNVDVPTEVVIARSRDESSTAGRARHDHAEMGVTDGDARDIAAFLYTLR